MVNSDNLAVLERTWNELRPLRPLVFPPLCARTFVSCPNSVTLLRIRRMSDTANHVGSISDSTIANVSQSRDAVVRA